MKWCQLRRSSFSLLVPVCQHAPKHNPYFPSAGFVQRRVDGQFYQLPYRLLDASEIPALLTHTVQAVSVNVYSPARILLFVDALITVRYRAQVDVHVEIEVCVIERGRRVVFAARGGSASRIVCVMCNTVDLCLMFKTSDILSLSHTHPLSVPDSVSLVL